LRGLPGGAEGIRTDGHRGHREIASYFSLRQSVRAACSRPASSRSRSTPSPRLRLPASLPAARRSPRLRRIEVERRRRNQHRKVFSRERAKTIQTACHGRSAGLACELDDCPCPEHIANRRLPFRGGFDNAQSLHADAVRAPSIPSFHDGAANAVSLPVRSNWNGVCFGDSPSADRPDKLVNR
jgi:hypothetical protein